MGKSLIIKGADFHQNGMKIYTWDIDFTNNLSSFAQACGSFENNTGTPYLPTLFGSQQTVRYVELGLACPDAGSAMPTAIKVFKINRSNNTATLITQANFTIPSKTSDEKMIIDLGQDITLGTDETIGFFGIKQSGSSENGSSIFGMTVDNDLPNVTIAFFKSNNLDYSANSFAITFPVISFKTSINLRIGK